MSSTAPEKAASVRTSVTVCSWQANNICLAVQLSTRFWDHLSDKHSTCLGQSESIDMARADVEIELAKCVSVALYVLVCAHLSETSIRINRAHMRAE